MPRFCLICLVCHSFFFTQSRGLDDRAGAADGPRNVCCPLCRRRLVCSRRFQLCYGRGFFFPSNFCMWRCQVQTTAHTRVLMGGLKMRRLASARVCAHGRSLMGGLKMRRLASADAPSQSLEVWGLSTLVVGCWVYVPSGMCSFGRQAMPCPALTLACALSGARPCPVLPSRWVLSCPDVRCCRACTTHSVQPLNHSHTRAHTHTHAGTGISGALQLGGGRVGGGGEHDHAPRCLPPPPPPHPNRRCQNVCCRRYIFFCFYAFSSFWYVPLSCVLLVSSPPS